MPIVVIPSQYQNYAAGIREICIQSKNLQEALKELITQYPDLSFSQNDDGLLKPFISVFIDNEQIANSNYSNVELKEDSVIRLKIH